MSHTPGPWTQDRFGTLKGSNGDAVVEYGSGIAHSGLPTDEYRANAQLRNSAPQLLEDRDKYKAQRDRLMQEMERYLPLLLRIEASGPCWSKATKGTGIATANGYRAAIAAAKEGK